MDNLRQKIINEARSWIGSPFRHQGRSKQGVDCAGLIYVVYKNTVGLEPDKDFTFYQEKPSSIFVFRAIRSYATRIKECDAGPADVIIISFNNSATHLGIMTDIGIIHSDAIVGRVIEQESLSGRIVAYFRMKGVAPWLV